MRPKVNPRLLENVPSEPSGEAQFLTTTTTTSTAPPIYPHIKTPFNSGITNFTIINDYIHYDMNGNGPSQPIKIQPSSMLVVANILFNEYSIPNRNNIFINSEIYLQSPS